MVGSKRKPTEKVGVAVVDGLGPLAVGMLLAVSATDARDSAKAGLTQVLGYGELKQPSVNAGAGD
jgi:hypothetical protein